MSQQLSWSAWILALPKPVAVQAPAKRRTTNCERAQAPRKPLPGSAKSADHGCAMPMRNLSGVEPGGAPCLIHVNRPNAPAHNVGMRAPDVVSRSHPTETST